MQVQAYREAYAVSNDPSRRQDHQRYDRDIHHQHDVIELVGAEQILRHMIDRVSRCQHRLELNPIESIVVWRTLE